MPKRTCTACQHANITCSKPRRTSEEANCPDNHPDSYECHTSHSSPTYREVEAPLAYQYTYIIVIYNTGIVLAYEFVFHVLNPHGQSQEKSPKPAPRPTRPPSLCLSRLAQQYVKCLSQSCCRVPHGPKAVPPVAHPSRTASAKTRSRIRREAPAPRQRQKRTLPRVLRDRFMPPGCLSGCQYQVTCLPAVFLLLLTIVPKLLGRAHTVPSWLCTMMMEKNTH